MSDFFYIINVSKSNSKKQHINLKKMNNKKMFGLSDYHLKLFKPLPFDQYLGPIRGSNFNIET